jgi:hypothetical protein
MLPKEYLDHHGIEPVFKVQFSLQNNFRNVFPSGLDANPFGLSTIQSVGG